MADFNLNDHPHRRYNALTGEWVLVSPHRAKRPWQGQVEKLPPANLPEYDPKCYLCPGNERAGGIQNPDYRDTFVFTNDFSALLPDTPNGEVSEDNLFVAKAEKGFCKVICFSHRHDLTVPQMDVPSVRKVVDVWSNEFNEMKNIDYINHIQIFENKGAVMGCSNPHPHCQIWAQSSIPVEIEKELTQLTAFYEKHNKTLLSVYLEKELEAKERIVCENDSFVALVPYWAVWPFETMIISKRVIRNIGEFTDKEKDDLADIYIRLTVRYDNLFETSFPYSMGLHQQPVDGKEYPQCHFHMHFFPPLLRSATVRKFMVGYEMMANPQRDITAEQSAERLRALSETHYTKA
ncbi:MAG: UDP-glucose--hexose-1-phosphate uridylyltransferase [Bacteroidales bacterium]|nr:UDP-glucose--hexose-1-phosphate uridylyltransferase [Bacteroidales bacterium]